MSKTIKVAQLSKAYQLGEIGTGTISNDLKRFWASVRGKEDPFLKIGEVNDRTVKGTSNVVWSLKDINFEVEQGDAVGIIGRNGAGKSTLLKILSRVTSPTTGTIKIKGRIASLLEVGTGFHPELTGKENIFLNGTILGMRKAEIRQKFDEIVAFSGVDRYIDTPVKRYSSGMYVRLAFAVAAYLESEILVVDEVLAVGDLEFQKKCLNKMGEVSKGEGRTVLFVSHNMAAVKKLCDKTIILENGNVKFDGLVGEGVGYYLNSQSNAVVASYANNDLTERSGFALVVIENDNGEPTDKFAFDEAIVLSLKLQVKKMDLGARLSIRFVDNLERIVFTTEKDILEFTESAGEITIKVRVPAQTLVPNRYILTMSLHKPNIQMLDLLEETISFEIIDTGSDFYHYDHNFGCVFVNCDWV
jgi:lipopolysaccharide transport system ATP-binding protein